MTKTAEERNGGRLDVNDEFTLIDNQWGNPDADQGVWLTDDGSYGWDFDATETRDGINYPEVFLGTRPWGSDTGVPEFPIRRREVDEFVFDIRADYSVSGGEWDFAQEWWLMEEDPTVTPETHRYEIMLLLDWGGGHDHGTPKHTDLWTDEYGNTIDLWTIYDSGGTNATFYIFRVQGGHDGGKIDACRIVDWLTDHEGIREDLYISGSELGTEYWPGAVGEATLSDFSVTINGTTYTNDGPTEDSTPPSAPSNLSSPTYDDSSVDLDWKASSDAGGSGLARYDVHVDGSKDHGVAATTTSTTVSELLPGERYDFSVTAVDSAGNESNPSNTVRVTTDDASDGPGGIQSGSVYRIENENSGLALDVEGASTRSGATVLQWPWHGGDNQRWRVVDNGDGTYRLESEHSGQVLDVAGASTAEGADILQWPWHGGDNQRWRVVDNGDGTYRLESKHSGLVFDVAGASTAEGANIHQRAWDGRDSQRWVLSSEDDL
jgi:hypothetical protein